MKLNVRTTVAALAATTAIAALGVGTATAAEINPGHPTSAADILESPQPDCADNGGVTPCYEYQTWFFTFDSCNDYAHQHPFDSSRYDRYVCAVFSGGLNVGLWFHKVRA